MTNEERHEIESIENQTIPVKLSSATMILISTITIVVSVMTTFYSLKGDIKDVSNTQSTQTQINNLRFTNDEDKQREDHEWLRSVAHRTTAIEQKTGIDADKKQTEDHSGH